MFFFTEHGFLDELDYWAGTFALVIVSLMEVILFGWVFGMEKGWKEMNLGADIQIPKIFYYVIKYVTPAYLIFILVFWTINDAIPTLLLENAKPENVPYIWLARGFMTAILASLLFLIWYAWKRNKGKSFSTNEINDL